MPVRRKFGWRVNLVDGRGVISTMATTMLERTVPVEVHEGELARFVEVEYGPLVAALGLLCGDRAAAEDAVQEALARALVALRKGTVIESLPAWVRVVALNHLRNRWRSLTRELRAVRRLGSRIDSDAESNPDDLIDLRAALGALTRRQREAVALYYRLDLSVAETALAMRVSDGTVKTLLSRARSVLAAVLELQEVGDD